MSLVGARVLRKEDPNLLTGHGKFVDDIAPVSTAFAQFVMSDQAHAKILSIDVSETLKMPGVLGVWTAADFIPYPNLPGGLPDLERPVLAHDRVRWAGEPVAIVVAENRYQAADAVPTVVIDYETLPAVITIDEATAPNAPLLFDSEPSNVLTKAP
ncbi:MAG: xanthine dehydrogenase family protein molybdopterin-binding subunit, partial [Actinobacteria bacterium]|nr:xanthine dehydrogenase family protein molybdopterin-binding subunit [Actinomycetota bacterium]